MTDYSVRCVDTGVKWSNHIALPSAYPSDCLSDVAFSVANFQEFLFPQNEHIFNSFLLQVLLTAVFPTHNVRPRQSFLVIVLLIPQSAFHGGGEFRNSGESAMRQQSAVQDSAKPICVLSPRSEIPPPICFAYDTSKRLYVGVVWAPRKCVARAIASRVTCCCHVSLFE